MRKLLQNRDFSSKITQRAKVEAKKREEEKLAFALRVEYHPTLGALNLVPGCPFDLRRRDFVAAPWTRDVEGSQNFIEMILLAGWHRRPILLVANNKRKAFLVTISPVRPVKLDFFDHPFRCPLCKEQIVYTSMHTVSVSSRRKCPSCQGELLINEGTVTAISDKKAPKRVGLATAKRSRK